MTSATDIVNQAIQMIGNNVPPVTGALPSFDSSPAGKAAAALYTPCVQTVGRQFGWDMSRNTVALGLSGNVAPVPWGYEYLYPSNGIQVWQLVPQAINDPNDPRPVNWVVANAFVNDVQRKVIHTNLVSARAVYNNNPIPDVWDPLFRESVVRLLASEMAMALAGKPDTAAAALESGMAFVQVGKTRDS